MTTSAADTTFAALGLSVTRIERDGDLRPLTALVHRAYASHLAEGRSFVAATQSQAVTKQRIGNHECWAVASDNALAGTVTVMAPGNVTGTPYANQPGVASFSQLGVDPWFKGKGLGNALLAFAEGRCEALGAERIVTDTSTKASALVDWYLRHGYRAVETFKNRATGMESVILAKSLRTGLVT
jgi:ribosomal protein S18 acetylase RimI-like enzyme